MPPNKLADKLIQVMKEAGRVPKNGWNEYHSYAYILEADIMDTVRGKLADLGVLILTSVEETVKQGPITEVHTKHTFIDAESGEHLEVKGYGQGADTGDKGGYKAITGAVKYALQKNFLLSSGDDPEKDADLPPPPAPRANGAAPKPNGAPKPAQQKPAANKAPAPQPAARPAAAPKPATTEKPADAPKNGDAPKADPKPAPAPKTNGEGPKPTTRPANTSTPSQQQAIKRLAKELGLDVQKDIFDKMGIEGQPSKEQASRIITRLNEKKSNSARR